MTLIALEFWTLTALLGGVEPLPPKPIWPLSADAECATAMMRRADVIFTDPSVVGPTSGGAASFATLTEHEGEFVRLSGFFHDALFASRRAASLPLDDPNFYDGALYVDLGRALGQQWQKTLPSLQDRCVRVEGRFILSDGLRRSAIDDVRRLEVWSEPNRPLPVSR